MKTIFNGFAFDCSANPPIYCAHEITRDDAGAVHHMIDGKIRASVSGEHAAAYLSGGWVKDIGRDSEQWPELAKVRAPNAIAFHPQKQNSKKPAFISGKKK